MLMIGFTPVYHPGKIPGMDYRDPSEAGPESFDMLSPLPIRRCEASIVHPGHRWSKTRVDPSAPAGYGRTVVWCPGQDELVVQLPELVESGNLAVQPDNQGDPVPDSETRGPSPVDQGIAGYRELTEQEVALVNECKRLERRVARFHVGLRNAGEATPQWLDVAYVHLHEGFSAMTRAITKPRDPFDEGLGDPE